MDIGEFWFEMAMERIKFGLVCLAEGFTYSFLSPEIGWSSIIQNDFHIFSEDEFTNSLCFIKPNGKEDIMIKSGVVQWRYVVTRQQSITDFKVSSSIVHF